MKNFYYISFFIVFLIIGVLLCSKNIGGGGTIETTNGIVGYIQTEDNLPVDGAIVKLIPENYDPVKGNIEGDIIIDTTDENGSYSFRNILAGKYNIIARQVLEYKSLIVKDIIVNEKSITKVTKGIIKKSATINVKLFNPVVKEDNYIYIPGTDIFSYVNNDGFVTLQDVPCGKITEIVLTYGDAKKENIITDTLEINANENKTIEWSLWNYKRKIVLNTTSNGANVQKNIYNFPLLIRLTNDNFDFSTVNDNEEDFVFTKVDNTILNSEIERWDSKSKKAEIWVLMDTIYGNDSSQSIFMYWGNKEKFLYPTGKVFDTTYGFQGVWHLGDSLRDVTQNCYNGISSENSKPQTNEGIIGKCLYFDGIDDFVTIPNTANSKLNFPEKGYYTVYVWVQLDTLDGSSHCIVSKGYEQYYLRSTYISPDMKLTTPYWEFVEFSETEKWQAQITPATPKQWCLLVGVKEGDKQYLYCNGELMDTTIDYWRNTVSRNTENDLTIGRFAKPVTVPINEGYCPFKGYIDEVRIINKAQSPEWIKLCYMNQRLDDRLVKIK